MSRFVKFLPSISSMVLTFALAAGAPLFAAEAPAQVSVPALPARPAVTLHIGDPAPALQYKEWIKGTEVKAFEKGHVYVIDFWATWCGWCKSGMPHMSELARKYAGKVTFIAVDSLEAKSRVDGSYPYSKVEAFVKNAHDILGYDVAADTPDEATYRTWAIASGADGDGIPHAFIVDQDGKLAWDGYPPVGLDQALPLVLEHKLDERAARRLLVAGQRRVGEALGLIQAMDEALKDPAAAKQAIACADQAMKLDPIFNFLTLPGKYAALVASDPAAARAFAEAAIADPANGPYALTALAAKIVDRTYAKPDYVIAGKVMEAIMANSDPEDSNLFATRALVAFKNGDAAQAVSLERKLLDSTTARMHEMKTHLPNGWTEEMFADYSRKTVAPLEEALKEYEAGLQHKS
jgi:thiol-disulfide isomerase/thioredoxin